MPSAEAVAISSSLLLSGRRNPVLDPEQVIALQSLGLYAHLQCPPASDDVPLPVGAV